MSCVVGVRLKISDRVDRKGLEWFGLVELLSEKWLINRMYESEVADRGDITGFARFGWTVTVTERYEIEVNE